MDSEPGQCWGCSCLRKAVPGHSESDSGQGCSSSQIPLGDDGKGQLERLWEYKGDDLTWAGVVSQRRLPKGVSEKTSRKAWKEWRWRGYSRSKSLEARISLFHPSSSVLVWPTQEV